MAETLFQVELQSSPKESRFGNIEAHLDTMKEGDYFVIHGKIEDFIDVSPHANLVNLAEIANNNPNNDDETSANYLIDNPEKVLPVIPDHRNIVELISIANERESILGIHKPAEGEDPKIKGDVKHCCVREEIAFNVSDHFCFDLVPPTIDRDEGSFQYFMDPKKYCALSNKPEEIEIDWKEVSSGLDFQKMALFDWLTLGVDRRESNYLINIEDPKELIAIDNGLSFGPNLYRRATQLYGPTSVLTSEKNPSYENDKTQPEYLPKIIQMPDKLIEMLKNGLERSRELTKKLREASFTRYIEDNQTGDLIEKKLQNYLNKKLNNFGIECSYLSIRAFSFLVKISKPSREFR